MAVAILDYYTVLWYCVGCSLPSPRLAEVPENAANLFVMSIIKRISARPAFIPW
jgi:hypothetical protein